MASFNDVAINKYRKYQRMDKSIRSMRWTRGSVYVRRATLFRWMVFWSLNGRLRLSKTSFESRLIGTKIRRVFSPLHLHIVWTSSVWVATVLNIDSAASDSCFFFSFSRISCNSCSYSSVAIESGEVSMNRSKQDLEQKQCTFEPRSLINCSIYESKLSSSQNEHETSSWCL